MGRDIVGLPSLSLMNEQTGYQTRSMYCRKKTKQSTLAVESRETEIVLVS
jgi:hypothetical protein